MPLRAGLGLIGVLILGAGACSSSAPDQLNTSKAADEIHKLAVKAYSSEAEVGTVSCPGAVDMEKGGVFTCTVAINGVPLTISVRQKDNKGTVHFSQAEAVIFASKAEQFVASYADEHGTATSSVSCAKTKIITRAPGTKISCAVGYADGTTGVATLVVRDTVGKVGLVSIKPSTG
jgi:hypothetical protein